MAEVKRTPLDVLCPACFSTPHTPCTAPDSKNGRRNVTWLHHARDAALADELRHEAKVRAWIAAGTQRDLQPGNNPALLSKIYSLWGRKR